jgi:hypothetical protein
MRVALVRVALVRVALGDDEAISRFDCPVPYQSDVRHYTACIQ